jgi:hypothetical protein
MNDKISEEKARGKKSDLAEVVKLEVARSAVAVERDALRRPPRRRQRRRVELQRLPVPAAPVELVRPLHRLGRARHRRGDESGRNLRDSRAGIITRKGSVGDLNMGG